MRIIGRVGCTNNLGVASLSTRTPTKVPLIIDSRVNGIGNMHHRSGAFRVRVNTGSESSSAQFGGKYKDLHLSMATGLPAVDDVEPFSPGTG